MSDEPGGIPLVPVTTPSVIGGNGRANFKKSHLFARLASDPKRAATSTLSLLPAELPVRLRQQSLREYLQRFIALWNKVAREHNRKHMLLRENVDIDDCLVNPNVIELARQLYNNKGDFSFIDIAGFALLEDKINYSQKLLLALRQPGFKNVAFLAETQWGKTIVLVLTALFHNLWAKNQKNDEGGEDLCFIVNLRQNSPHAQTIDDFDGTLDLIANVAFRGFDTTVHQANSELMEDLQVVTSLMEEDAKRRSEIEDDSEELAKPKKAGKKGPTHVVLKRGDKEVIDYIIKMAKLPRAGRQTYSRITLLIDEADEASGNRSVIDAWLANIKKQGVQARFLLCSATAWQYRDADDLIKVEVKDVPPEYSGLVEGTRTSVISMTEFAKLAKLDGLRNFVLTRSGNSENLNMVGSAILACQEGLLSEDHRLNGKRWNGGKGCMLRAGENSAMARNMADALRPMLAEKGITMLPYHEGSFKKQEILVNGRIETIRYNTVDKMIRAAIAVGVTDYCVIVIGAGRRADRFPRHCTCFLDFTPKFSTMAAMEQGTLGRASGWLKATKHMSTFVLLSDINAEYVRKFRWLFDKFGRKCPVDGLKPSGNAHSLFHTSAKKRTSIRIKFDEKPFNTPAMQAWRRHLVTNVIMPYLEEDEYKMEVYRSEVLSGNSVRIVKNPNKGKGVWYYFPIYEMLGAAGIAAIEGSMKEVFGNDAELLLPNQVGIKPGRRSKKNPEGKDTERRLACLDEQNVTGVLRQSKFIRVTVGYVGRNRQGGEDQDARDARGRNGHEPTERGGNRDDLSKVPISFMGRWDSGVFNLAYVTLPLRLATEDLSSCGPIVDEDTNVIVPQLTASANCTYTPINSVAALAQANVMMGFKRNKVRPKFNSTTGVIYHG